MPPRIDDATRAAILADLRAQNGSAHDIAKRHGVGQASVSRFAKAAGIPLDRSRTKKATRAREADLAADRAQLKADLLADAQELRRRARSPYTYYERGSEGPELVTLPLPPLRETREAYTALGIALDKHLKLDQHDQTGGTDELRESLADLGRALGIDPVDSP